MASHCSIAMSQKPRKTAANHTPTHSKTMGVSVANAAENTTMTDTNDVKRILGKWYDSADEMDSYVAKRAYEVISLVDEVWYDRIPVNVVWTTNDPYDDYQDMRQTVKRENELRVFAGGSEPEYKSHEDNVKGRAVHDWFGHLEANCSFSMSGEWTKYNHVKHRYPSWVRPLLFTEIVGQRAAASYYKDGFFDDAFRQKATFAPTHIMDFARTELSDK